MIWHELERRTEALTIVRDYGMTFPVPLLGRLRYGRYGCTLCTTSQLGIPRLEIITIANLQTCCSLRQGGTFSLKQKPAGCVNCVGNVLCMYVGHTLWMQRVRYIRAREGRHGNGLPKVRYATIIRYLKVDEA